MQPHIECRKGDIAPIVLLPGDPKRVNLIGSFLDEYREVADNREFRTITGTYQGVPVSVTSTGIGCPSTAIAVEELIVCGAKILIRVGTCGSAWREEITPLSVVIPTACVRDEGTTIEYIPEGFPAVADTDIVAALTASAQEQGIRFFRGINRTHDSFYAPDRSVAKWGEFYLDQRFNDTPSPILSSEMETSALFVIATLMGVRAGAVLAVDAEPTPLKSMVLRQTHLPNVAFKNKDISTEAQKSMIRTALGALKHIR
ncbi:MAG: nucleoside phosphorylase [Candidatus Magasanikbacteria bacterium]|nr:nucleoside phosphorylase [Candidatus Magasanikbacteria bacterium]